MTNFLNFKWVLPFILLLVFLTKTSAYDLINIKVTEDGYTNSIDKQIKKNDRTAAKNAEALDIKQSNIHILTGEVCSIFTKVQVFHAKGLQMKIVQKTAFKDCKKLVKLDLYNNFIYFLHAETFNFCPDLEYVSLFGNRLTEIPPGIFQQNQKLKKIILKKNRLRTFPDSLVNPTGGTGALPNLMELHLNLNEITDLNVFNIKAQFPQLKKFYFEYNFLTCEKQNKNENFCKQNNIDVTVIYNGANAKTNFFQNGPNGCINLTKTQRTAIYDGKFGGKATTAPKQNEKQPSNCSSFPEWALIATITIGLVTIVYNSVMIRVLFKDFRG